MKFILKLQKTQRSSTSPNIFPSRGWNTKRRRHLGFEPSRIWFTFHFCLVDRYRCLVNKLSWNHFKPICLGNAIAEEKKIIIQRWLEFYMFVLSTKLSSLNIEHLVKTLSYMKVKSPVVWLCKVFLCTLMPNGRS